MRPIVFVTTGDTSLGYDVWAHHSVQNWKVPKTPGSWYIVRTTTVADGLALTARLRVK